VEIAPRNPDVIVHTPSNVGENPVDVESWLPVGKPLRHKGFRGYPLPVEIALVLRSRPLLHYHVISPPLSAEGHTGGNGGKYQNHVTNVTLPDGWAYRCDK
jgi:hypothetical protein